MLSALASEFGPKGDNHRTLTEGKGEEAAEKDENVEREPTAILPYSALDLSVSGPDMQVVTANPLSVHLTEICHGLSRLSKIAVLSALAPEFSPQPAVLSAFASEFGPKGDDHRTGGIAPTVRKMGGKGQPLGLAPDGRRKEGDPLAPTLKTPVLESDPKPHADLTFISSEASGGGKRKGAWRGPVDFFDASVASGASPVVHMQRVRAVGQLLKDADYDVGRLLNQLGSLAYQTGSDQQEEFPQEFVEEMGEDLLQEMREGFRVPTSKVLEEEDPEKRALRLRALAAAGAKGVKGPSARAEFLITSSYSAKYWEMRV